MKVISWVILACVILLGGYVAYLQFTSQNQEKLVGTFTGALPCADCEQLKTTLTLYEQSGNPSTYTLEQVYVGKNVDPLIKKGQWEIQIGTPQDPNAIVYVLNSNQEKSRQLYAQELNPNELQLLNQDQGKISSPLNFKLKKQ